MKNIKDFKGLYCLRPFTHIDITLDDRTACCCESWLPDFFGTGDIEKLTLEELWNSDRMQSLRQSVLDGTYSYCSKEKCPYLNSEEFRLYTRNELQQAAAADSRGEELEDSLLELKDHAPWIKNILDGRTFLKILPASFNLAYDETCNLRCPSCRQNNIVHTKGPEYERRRAVHKKLFDTLEKSGYENVRCFFVTGAGDPFASSIYREFLYNFDGTRYPQLKFFIMTNGMLLTPEVWEKMIKIHSNISNIFISIDAAAPETYERIRVNGNLNTLLKNIEFLGRKRKENTLNNLILAFIVQRKNYKEMVDIISIAKKYNSDQITFSGLDDWQTWERQEFNENAVCNPDHEEYSRFLEILKSPEFDDHIVNLGNITKHRVRALSV
ncbi:MAG: Radical domain protein [Eubacterium sp.]|nr:Radical domain protein [Eubacterium sp.]